MNECFLYPLLLTFSKQNNFVKGVFVFPLLICFLRPSCSSENHPFCEMFRSLHGVFELLIACLDLSFSSQSQRDELTLKALFRKRKRNKVALTD